jgi:hypothetical protein
VAGPEVERLSILTADGVLAEGPPGEITAELVVGAPTYVVALAEGGPHPRSLFTGVFAHTSPVYVDVRGRRAVRAEDLHWCLEWLDRLERLVRERARLDTKEQLGDHLDLIARRGITTCRLYAWGPTRWKKSLPRGGIRLPRRLIDVTIATHSVTGGAV